MTQTGTENQEEFKTKTVFFGEGNEGSIRILEAIPTNVLVIKTDDSLSKQMFIQSEKIFIDATKLGGGTPTINTFADLTEFKFKENSSPWLSADFDSSEIFLGNTTDLIDTFDIFVGTFSVLNDSSQPILQIDSAASSTSVFGDFNVTGVSSLGDGGTTNYTEFDVTGKLNLFGTARVKNRIRVLPTGAGLGASTPTEALRAIGASGDVLKDVLKFSNNLQNDAYVEFEGSSANDDSEDSEFIITWLPGTSYTSGNYVWVLEFLIKNIGDDLTTGVPTTITADVTPANADDLIETVFATGINLDAGQVLIGHFFRDTASDNADDTGDINSFELESIQNKLGENL